MALKGIFFFCLHSWCFHLCDVCKFFRILFVKLFAPISIFFPQWISFLLGLKVFYKSPFKQSSIVISAPANPPSKYQTRTCHEFPENQYPSLIQSFVCACVQSQVSLMCAWLSNHSFTFCNPGQWVARKSVRSVTPRWEKERPWSSSPSSSVIIWAVLRWELDSCGHGSTSAALAKPRTLTWSLKTFSCFLHFDRTILFQLHKWDYLCRSLFSKLITFPFWTVYLRCLFFRGLHSHLIFCFLIFPANLFHFSSLSLKSRPSVSVLVSLPVETLVNFSNQVTL